MSPMNEEPDRSRLAELEAENARLRETLDMVKAERKELRDRLDGPINDENLPSEGEYMELMKSHVPGSGLKFFADLGIFPIKPT
jgi:predicted nuclease with TOPRIM domain